MNSAVLEFTIKNQELLLEFLYNNIKNKSKNNIKSLLNRGNVFVNNKSITKFDYKLNINDKILIKLKQINDKNNNRILDIIYEDNDIIVINKPHNLLSISTEKEKNNTAYKLVMEYLKHNKSSNKVFIVHRLDRETSGILLFAKNEKIKYLLQENWNDIVKIRNYIAIVEGNIENSKGKIVSNLKQNKENIVYSNNDGKTAITNYIKINSNKHYSMLNINIETGRKNQIRVHLKDIGHPIVGDKKYGSNKDALRRLCLHANILEIYYPITNKLMHFESQIPLEFMNMFKKRSD